MHSWTWTYKKCSIIYALQAKVIKAIRVEKCRILALRETKLCLEGRSGSHIVNGGDLGF